MSDEDKSLPPIPSIVMDGRWVVDNSFSPLPEEIETVDEIPIGTYNHELSNFNGIEDDHPDPLEYFEKLKRTLIWTIILSSIGCSIAEFVFIKFFM